MISTERCCEHGVRYDAICDLCSGILDLAITGEPEHTTHARIRELESDRRNFQTLIRMCLEQFEFQYGKRQRGWDARFLMDRCEALLNQSMEPTLGADGRYCTHHDDDPAHTTECYKPPSSETDNIRFTAYNQAVEDALSAIREESRFTDGAAPFINAIARHCSPHRYVASLVARPQTHEAPDPYRPICRHCGLADIAGDWAKYPCNDEWRKEITTNY